MQEKRGSDHYTFFWPNNGQFKLKLLKITVLEYIFRWVFFHRQDPRQYREGHRESVQSNLPSAGCVHPESEDSQEAQS